MSASYIYCSLQSSAALSFYYENCCGISSSQSSDIFRHRAWNNRLTLCYEGDIECASLSRETFCPALKPRPVKVRQSWEEGSEYFPPGLVTRSEMEAVKSINLWYCPPDLHSLAFNWNVDSSGIQSLNPVLIQRAENEGNSNSQWANVCGAI